MLDARLSTLTFATKKTYFKRTGRDFSTCWPSRSNGTRRATLHLSRLPFCLDICKKPNRSTKVSCARGWLIQFLRAACHISAGRSRARLRLRFEVKKPPAFHVTICHNTLPGEALLP